MLPLLAHTTYTRARTPHTHTASGPGVRGMQPPPRRAWNKVGGIEQGVHMLTLPQSDISVTILHRATPAEMCYPKCSPGLVADLLEV